MLLVILLALMLGTCLVLGIVLVIISQSDSAASDGGGGSSPEQTTPFTQFVVNGGDLKVSGRHSIVEKDGKKVFEVILKKGQIHPGGTNTSISMRPSQFFPSDACRVKFKLYFDDQFPWTESGSFKVGGKLGGFEVGQGQASGSNFSKEAASYRLVFRKDRGAAAYLYPQLKQAFSGDVSWDQIDQLDSLKSQSYIAAGVHIFAPDRNPSLFFKSKQWNTVEMYMKLNTPGKYDGIMELAINGDRRRLDQVRYRYTGERIESFNLAPFFGGSNTTYAPPTDVRLWYTDFQFSKT